jgi:Anti sigma-E protein RseA, N-terminal domain.
MRCEKAQRLISLWLDGMLGNEDEQALLAHIENCRHCRQVWRDWEQIRVALRSYPSATLSPEFDRKLLSRLKGEESASATFGFPLAFSPSLSPCVFCDVRLVRHGTDTVDAHVACRKINITTRTVFPLAMAWAWSRSRSVA